MTRLTWDALGDRNFESGVDHGVFYPIGGVGYAWSGLLSVKETTVDAGQSITFLDGVGYSNQVLIGSFAATISALTYPDEFEPYDGYSGYQSGQRRREFNFCYRTLQADGNYKIHLVYNALATPNDRNNSSINTAVDMELFNWDLSTRPEPIPGLRASAHFVVDTKTANPGTIEDLETILYGDANTQPTMPTVDDLLAFFEDHAILKITVYDDGTFTAEGPDDVVYMLDGTTFAINWPTVVYLDADTYQVSSL